MNTDQNKLICFSLNGLSKRGNHLLSDKHIKNQEKLITAFLVLIIVITSFSLRVYKLDEQGFNEDEIEKVSSAKKYSNGDFDVDLEHPPLHKFILFLTLEIFGESEIKLRLPNVIFGTLTCVVLFFIGVELFDRRVGFLAGLLLSIFPIVIGNNRIAKVWN